MQSAEHCCGHTRGFKGLIRGWVVGGGVQCAATVYTQRQGLDATAVQTPWPAAPLGQIVRMCSLIKHESLVAAKVYTTLRLTAVVCQT